MYIQKYLAGLLKNINMILFGITGLLFFPLFCIFQGFYVSKVILMKQILFEDKWKIQNLRKPIFKIL